MSLAGGLHNSGTILLVSFKVLAERVFAFRGNNAIAAPYWLIQDPGIFCIHVATVATVLGMVAIVCGEPYR